MKWGKTGRNADMVIAYKRSVKRCPLEKKLVIFQGTYCERVTWSAVVDANDFSQQSLLYKAGQNLKKEGKEKEDAQGKREKRRKTNDFS